MAIIFKPILTEKQTAISDKFAAQKLAKAKKTGGDTAKLPARYGFLVAPNANKAQIQKAIEELYGVKVDKVNTTNYSGKRTSRNTTSGVILGRKPAYKKAIITLKEGESIDFFSNI